MNSQREQIRCNMRELPDVLLRSVASSVAVVRASKTEHDVETEKFLASLDQWQPPQVREAIRELLAANQKFRDEIVSAWETMAMNVANVAKALKN